MTTTEDKKPLAKWLNILLWVCRILVGGLFIFSGFIKANDFVGFSYKLDEYWHVFGTDWLEPTSKFMAWFISVFEIAIGVATLVGWRMKYIGWLLMAMIVFFTFLTWYSWFFNAVQDCGCFGDAIKLTPFESFMKDIILTVLILPLFIWGARIKPVVGGSIPMIISVVSFLIAGFWSFQNYRYIPTIDFRPYAIGENMYKNTIPGEWNMGDPKAHDYPPLGIAGDCGQESYGEFKGASLLIILKQVENCPEEALSYASELTRQLKDTDIKVYGMCSSLPEEVDAFKQKYNDPFCIAPVDQTVLKTIIRSTPGYLMLKDGNIVGKWAYRSPPTRGDLLEVIK